MKKHDVHPPPKYLQPQPLHEGMGVQEQGYITVDLQVAAPSSGQHSWNNYFFVAVSERTLRKREAPRHKRRHLKACPHQLHLSVGPSANQLHSVEVGELHLQLLQLAGRLLIWKGGHTRQPFTSRREGRKVTKVEDGEHTAKANSSEDEE